MRKVVPGVYMSRVPVRDRVIVPGSTVKPMTLNPKF